MLEFRTVRKKCILEERGVQTVLPERGPTQGRRAYDKQRHFSQGPSRPPDNRKIRGLVFSMRRLD